MPAYNRSVLSRQRPPSTPSELHAGIQTPPLPRSQQYTCMHSAATGRFCNKPKLHAPTQNVMTPDPASTRRLPCPALAAAATSLLVRCHTACRRSPKQLSLLHRHCTTARPQNCSLQGVAHTPCCEEAFQVVQSSRPKSSPTHAPTSASDGCTVQHQQQACAYAHMPMCPPPRALPTCCWRGQHVRSYAGQGLGFPAMPPHTAEQPWCDHGTSSTSCRCMPCLQLDACMSSRQGTGTATICSPHAPGTG
jgi:hypothetical protein